MKLITERTVIEILDVEHAKLMQNYYLENKEHLEPWEPVRDEEYFTLRKVSELLYQGQQMSKNKTALRFTALNHKKTEVIGICNFTNIIYGAFQACNLGYSIAERYQGKGLMSEILKISINNVFEQLNLHRIMANYIPSNVRSEKLLVKLGFEKEGVAKSYLKIAGKWQDHVLTSKINPRHLK